MRHLTILIDMDDVLQDLIGNWVNVLNTKFGTNVGVEDIIDWNIENFFPNVSREELFSTLRDPNLWYSLKATPGAQETVKQIIKDGHTVRVVTASHYIGLPAKIEHFLSLYPFLSWKDIIIAYDKSVISGDVIIDDGVHNLKTAICPHKMLFERTHNLSYDAEVNGITRVKSWDEVYDIILKIGGVE